jgi:hypothetical protein
MQLIDTTDLPMIVLGATFRDFYENHWPKDWYVEDMPMEVEDENGTYIWPDAQPLKLGDLGWAVYDGPTTGELRKGKSYPMAALYHTVMATQPTVETIVFRLAPADAVRLRAAAEALGFAPFQGTRHAKGAVDPNV